MTLLAVLLSPPVDWGFRRWLLLLAGTSLALTCARTDDGFQGGADSIRSPGSAARTGSSIGSAARTGSSIGSPSSPDPETALDPDLRELAEWMTGSFSSREQALRDTAFFDIRLHMVSIWPHETEGRWLYVEQAEADALEEPYRQRVYHLTSQGDGVWKSAIYTLPGDPLAFAGAWRDDEPLAGLSPDDLTPREGCAVHLRRNEEGSFVGSTEEGACPSSLRGAAYATTEVSISEDHFVSWDRGFDEDGAQVWGSRAGGYVFEKTGSL